MDRYYVGAELYHFGIPGMKWGVRRYQNPDGTLTEAGKRRYAINEAKDSYRDAKQRYREVKKEKVRGVVASRELRRKIDDRYDRKEEARMNIIDAKADIKKAKRGDKAAEKYYSKQMKRYGLPGSSLDYARGNKATKLYDHIAAKRGEEYAKKVEKRVRNQLVKQLVGSAAVLAGTAIVNKYLSSNRNTYGPVPRTYEQADKHVSSYLLKTSGENYKDYTNTLNRIYKR